ncbi:histidine phosphatase family protein [Microbacterium aurantiacum]|uniref:histidine phosphatase family protein n=1 Tax=Microbacterium aurantiacum TaxID=162393 RepID=UPI003D709E8C
MTHLTMIRHGQTDWNRDLRIQGSTDIPLNDTGRAQAREAAQALALRPEAPTRVVSSDLSRARETAEIIAEILDLETPRVYPALRERAYGEAEGLETAEFFQRFGDWHTAQVPGAEPWPELRARALGGLAEAVADIRRDTAPAPASLIVVSHGALIRELLRHATAGAFPPPGQRLPNASAYDLRYERERLSLLSYAGA